MVMMIHKGILYLVRVPTDATEREMYYRARHLLCVGDDEDVTVWAPVVFEDGVVAKVLDLRQWRGGQ